MIFLSRTLNCSSLYENIRLRILTLQCSNKTDPNDLAAVHVLQTLHQESGSSRGWARMLKVTTRGLNAADRHPFLSVSGATHEGLQWGEVTLITQLSGDLPLLLPESL